MSRRAIANSNERRRMQSINAGFQQLKELVRPGETEKLSKVKIQIPAMGCTREALLASDPVLVRVADAAESAELAGISIVSQNICSCWACPEVPREK
jgi:hypothetical protein